MANNDMRGRRVVDSKPVVRAPLDEYGFPHGADPEVWNTYKQARNAMHRIDRRIAEAEKPASSQLYPDSLLSSNPSDRSVPVDRVPCYTAPASSNTSTSVKVDSYGRSQYLKSREAAIRKVSRLDDKYREEESSVDMSGILSRNPSGLSSNINRTHSAPTSNGNVSTQPQHRDYTSQNPSTSYPTSSRPVLRDTTTSYLSHLTENTVNASNLTDSRAVRETERRFLNDTPAVAPYRSASDHIHRPLLPGSQPARLTHVDVRVPSNYHSSATGSGSANYFGSGVDRHFSNGITRYTSSTGKADVNIGHTGSYPNNHSSNSAIDPRAGRGYTDAVSSAQGGLTSSNTTFTIPSSSKATIRSLKSQLQKDKGGLDRVLDLVDKQRAAKLSTEPSRSAGRAEDMSAAIPPSLHMSRAQHHDDEPIVPKQYRLYDTEEQPTKLRKVAVGPRGPTYKGFNEVETRYKVAEARAPRSTDGSLPRKHKRRKTKEQPVATVTPVAAAVQEAKESLSNEKKPQRITATKKPSKYEKQNIITTSSWRVGKEAILRELGPNKLVMPKREIKPEDGEDKLDTKEDFTPKIPTKISDNAKSVLADLQSDHEPEKLEQSPEKPKIPPKRRKPKPKTPEAEKINKIRIEHDDKVKEYMKQKRIQARKQRQHENEEKRREQERIALNKRKVEEEARSAVLEAKRKAKQKHLDAGKPKPGSGSDKENRGLAAWSDISSSGDSTLTGESGRGILRMNETFEDTRDVEMEKDPETKARLPGELTKDSGIATATGIPMATGVTAADVMKKYIEEEGASNLISKFAENIGKITKDYSEKRDDLLRNPFTSLPAASKPSPLDTTSLDRKNRILRLKDSAQLLTSKIQQTSSQFLKDRTQVADVTDPDDYVSRYAKIVGSRDNYSVFDRDLPGASGKKLRGSEDFDENAHPSIEEVVAKYAGVRPELHPSGVKHSAGRKFFKREDDELSDSTMADSLLDEDGMLPSQRMVHSLGTPGYHVTSASSSRPLVVGAEKPSSHSLPMRATKPMYKLGEFEPDPNSFVNILSKKQRYHLMKEKPSTLYDNYIDKTGTGPGQRVADLDGSGASGSDASYTEDFTGGSRHSVGRATSALSAGSITERQRAAAAGAAESSSSGRTRSPPVSLPSSSQSQNDMTQSTVTSRTPPVMTSSASVTSQSSLVRQRSRDEATSGSSSQQNSLSQHTISQHSLSQHTISHPSRSEHSRGSQSKQRSSSKRDSSNKDGSSSRSRGRDGSVHSDDTLDGTLTPSAASGDELLKSGGAESAHSLSADRSLVLSSKHTRDESDVSISSMSEDERPQTRPQPSLVRDQDRLGSFGTMPPIQMGGRLGPDSLSSRLTAELNLYEGQEEMLRQIADVERVRASALAQQESVAIAQVNKAREQEHKHQVRVMEISAEQESLSARRAMEESTRHARDAARDAQQALHEIRMNQANNWQESAARLIETQEHAAKAAQTAYQQLARIHSSNNSSGTASNRVAMDAASAAVAAVMGNMRPVMGSSSRGVDRSAQYSSRQDMSIRDQSADTSMPDSYSSVTSYSSSSTRTTQKSRQLDSKYTTPRDRTSHSSIATDIPTGSELTPRDLRPSHSARSITTASISTESRDNQRAPLSARSITTASISSESHDLAALRSARSLSAAQSISTESYSRGGAAGASRSISTASVITERSRHSAVGSASSVATDSGAGPMSPLSKSDSIAEEIHSEKENDYSLEFDTSITEDDMEKSMREVLPAESLRQKIKRSNSQSDLNDYSSDEISRSLESPAPSIASRRLSFEEDSFTRFTVDMMRQYMKEDEIRSKHQENLLKLRERALREKTQAELAWLEQQKKRFRDKGADDQFPQFKKRKRGLLLRLQQEQAEIKRLKEAERLKARERAMMLKQAEEINRMKQNTKQVLRKLRQKKLEATMGNHGNSSSTSVSESQMKEKLKTEAPVEISDINTEDETSLHLEDDTERSRTPSPTKGSDTSGNRRESLDNKKAMAKLKKLKLDPKYLTVREQRLRTRRMQAEELLAWKDQLDNEEKEVEALEKQALAKWNDKAPVKAERPKAKDAKPAKEDKQKPESEKISTEVQSPRSDASIVTESGTTNGRPTSTSDASVPEDVTESPSRSKRLGSGGSESSIPEEVSRSAVSVASSIEESIATSKSSKSSVSEDIKTEIHTDKKQPESDETIITNTSYNESFESESATPKSDSITTATGAITASPASPASPALNNKKAGPSSPKNLRAKLANDVPIAPKSPKSKSPFQSPVRRNSESESEDSFSFTHSETASDQSDVEGRIRALNQELVKRKREADQLKKEAKRRDKERLKAQEASLKKQIEAYDKYIDQVSREITREEADLKQGKSVRQPQIKQPADSKKLAKQKAESLTPPAGSYSSPEPPKLNRSESDSSKSSVEETIISSKPEVTSPGAEDVSQKQSPSPRGDRSPALDSSISENIYGTPTLSRYTSSSSTSRTDKKTSTPDRSSVPPSFDEKSPVKDDSSEVVDEAIDESVHTDVSVSGSGAMFKLDLGKKDEATKAEDKSSTTPRAGRTEATDYQTDTFAPDTGRSLTEDIAEESVQSEVEADISTKDDDTAPLFKLDLGKDDAKVSDEVKKEAAPSVHSETSEVKTETAAPDTVYSESDVSKPDSARSDVSKDSSAAPEKEDQPMPDSARSVKSALTEDEDDRSYSYSYSDSSRSEAEKRDKSKTYSEDFSTSQSSSKTASQSTSSASTRSTVTQSVSKPTKPAVEPGVKTPRDETAKESRVSSNKQSTDTDDDISEHFSDADVAEDLEGGDISERSGESPKFLVLDTTPTEKTFPEPELEKELDLSERLGASGASEVLADKPVAPVTQGESRVPEDGAGEAEVDESIAEDSELERIISSTAAAVEEFSAQIGAEESSEGSDNIFVDRESNKKDEVVTPTVAPASPVVESKDMSRTVLLEMVTDDAEDTTTDVEYVITPRTDDEEITAPPEEPKTEVKTPEPEVTEIEASPAEKNTAVDVTTKDLLNESFEAMISIHRRKRSSQSSEDEGLADEEVVPKLPALDLRDEGDTLEEKEPIERPEEPTPTSPEQESNLPKLKDPFDDDLFESKVSVGRGQSFPSFTAEPREIQAEETSDLDQLYDELGALTGDGDEWFDDDFGLGGIKTPPPYSSGKSDKSGSPSPSLKLQLQKVVPEPFYAVPHKTPEVHTLCGSAVNVYWEKRRYGESWSDVTIPDSYYGNSDMGNDNESMSRRAYKKLVFELTGDILREIYAEEEEDETGSDVTAQLGKGRKPRRKYFKGRTPPTHPDDVVPVVSQHVLNMLKLAETDKRPGPSRTKKWSSRKKRDAVDEVLLDELKEEEPQWVDYQQDELAVKMQVADSIFDNLLLECAQSMTSIMSRRKQGSTS